MNTLSLIYIKPLGALLQITILCLKNITKPSNQNVYFTHTTIYNMYIHIIIYNDYNKL